VLSPLDSLQVIYPQNGSNTPLYNAYGKYLVRLYINGVARKVIIDDRLPFDPVNKKLLCSCSQDPKEFWISLVEKAYLKLNGGYDFPGSNSGIDLYCLTGWIPEQIWFSDEQKRKDMDRKSGGHIPAGAVADPPAEPAAPVALDHRQSADRAWERLASAFKYGDCLVTISTSDSLSAVSITSRYVTCCALYQPYVSYLCLYIYLCGCGDVGGGGGNGSSAMSRLRGAGRATSGQPSHATS